MIDAITPLASSFIRAPRLLGALALGVLLSSFSVVGAQPTKSSMSADEQAVANIIKQRLTELRGAKEVDLKVSKSIQGLYEVVIEGGNFAYTDKEVNFIINGRLIDGKTLDDLTAISEAKFEQVDIKSLPLKNAIRIGKGKRVVYTFEDPRCGFCKKLATEFNGMEDLSVYVFPVSFLGPESTSQAKSILCNKKPADAWLNTMTKNSPPNAAASDEKCQKQLDDNNTLARKLHIQGTPAIIFADGSRFKGYAPKDQIESRLVEIASKK
jgi:thiol:disulfide interchange protein DsbC